MIWHSVGTCSGRTIGAGFGAGFGGVIGVGLVEVGGVFGVLDRAFVRRWTSIYASPHIR
jgi:hypothetical protein